MVPSVQRCFRLMDEYRMLEHIKAHSLTVTRVAQLLVRSLNEAGMHLSRDRILAGALLHDIGKTISLETGEDHCRLGKRICEEHGFEEIADLVADHVILGGYAEDRRISETEIVYYSDKRVNHDRIVSLDDRLAYILDRYGRNQDWIERRIRKNFQQCRQVEERLFSPLEFDPQSVAELAATEVIA